MMHAELIFMYIKESRPSLPYSNSYDAILYISSADAPLHRPPSQVMSPEIAPKFEHHDSRYSPWHALATTATKRRSIQAWRKSRDLSKPWHFHMILRHFEYQNVAIVIPYLGLGFKAQLFILYFTYSQFWTQSLMLCTIANAPHSY